MTLREPFDGYTMARLVLALGTLLTLLTNPTTSLGLAEGLLAGPTLQSVNLFHVAGPLGGRIAAILGLSLVLAGWRPRITGLLHFWIAWSVATGIRLPDGGDHVTSNLTLILVPVTLLDPRRSMWMEAATATEPWRRAFFSAHALVARIQVSLIYLHATVGKLDVTEWINGTALYYWMTSPMYGAPLDWQPALARLLGQPWISLTSTWSVLVFEGVLAGAVFLPPRERSRLFWPAVAFHALIAAFLGLASFFVAMSGALVLYCGAPRLRRPASTGLLRALSALFPISRPRRVST